MLAARRGRFIAQRLHIGAINDLYDRRNTLIIPRVSVKATVAYAPQAAASAANEIRDAPPRSADTLIMYAEAMARCKRMNAG